MSVRVTVGAVTVLALGIVILLRTMGRRLAAPHRLAATFMVILVSRQQTASFATYVFLSSEASLLVCLLPLGCC